MRKEASKATDRKKEMPYLNENLLTKAIVYVHSDNNKYHALYNNNKLICWDKNTTKIPVILRGLTLSYLDYQISDNACTPNFDQTSWEPPATLSYLHFVNRAERTHEYKTQKEINSNIKPEDFRYLKRITQT